ncbi:MAG: radical SAM protein, partial [Candidatus Omnitrophica bacterium]|nr:radical SAM protein [Candidatus Omnitrophota bacterium]
GEEAIVAFTAKHAQGKDITRIKNFWVKKQGKTNRNEPRALNNDLDTIALPDRELFSRSRQNKEYTVMAGRGCPFNCTYCNNNAFKKIYAGKGRLIRQRSIANIIQELKELKKKRSAEVINFHDDIFIMDLRRLREFAKRYRKEIGLPFICSVRADLVREETARLFKEAGCKKVFLGVETANDQLRLSLLKRNIGREDMLRAVNLFKKYGITVFTHNMVGLPHATIDDDLKTLRFNIKLKPDFASVTIFMPYPGTELGRLCIKERLVRGFDDIYETYHYKSPLKVPHRAQVNTLHKLFSLAAAYDGLLPRVEALVLRPGKYGFQKLQQIYVLYREYKYAKVLKPSLKVPEKVRRFLKDLAAPGKLRQ